MRDSRRGREERESATATAVSFDLFYVFRSKRGVVGGGREGAGGGGRGVTLDSYCLGGLGMGVNKKKEGFFLASRTVRVVVLLPQRVALIWKHQFGIKSSWFFFFLGLLSLPAILFHRGLYVHVCVQQLHVSGPRFFYALRQPACMLAPNPQTSPPACPRMEATRRGACSGHEVLCIFSCTVRCRKEYHGRRAVLAWSPRNFVQDGHGSIFVPMYVCMRSVCSNGRVPLPFPSVANVAGASHERQGTHQLAVLLDASKKAVGREEVK